VKREGKKLETGNLKSEKSKVKSETWNFRCCGRLSPDYLEISIITGWNTWFVDEALNLNFNGKPEKI
jgi:hypothetical protein